MIILQKKHKASIVRHRNLFLLKFGFETNFFKEKLLYFYTQIALSGTRKNKQKIFNVTYNVT